VYQPAAPLERSSAPSLHSPVLPPEVRSLFRREQELAAIVYRSGLLTAREVEAQVAGTIGNASVRMILNRLVRKGVLLEHRSRNRGTIVYGPALVDHFGRETALAQFAADIFGDSLHMLGDELASFLSNARSVSELEQCYLQEPPLEVRALAPRMREIADAVYRSGGATLADVISKLPDVENKDGTRTLMSRLEKRGVLKRRRSGRHKELIYFPAILTPAVRRMALRRFIDERFNGSPAEALQTVMQLLRSQQTLSRTARLPDRVAEAA
jgi:predicted transcriptional regulator